MPAICCEGPVSEEIIADLIALHKGRQCLIFLCNREKNRQLCLPNQNSVTFFLQDLTMFKFNTHVRFLLFLNNNQSTN